MDERIEAVLDSYHRRIEEEKIARQRAPGLRDSLSNDQLMRAVGPQTGRLINLLARSLHAPTIVEIGTSFGYSGIWLAEAARATGGRVVTMEMYEHKSRHARQMAGQAGLDGYIEFQLGDARELLAALPDGIDFVLLDLWKDLYEPCLELFYPKLNAGAIVVADNMIQPENEGIGRYGRAVRAKPGMTSVQLPVGAGVEISRFEPRPAYRTA